MTTPLLPPVVVWQPVPIARYRARPDAGHFITVQIAPTSDGSRYSVRFADEKPHHRWTSWMFPDGFLPDMDAAEALIRTFYPQAVEVP